MKQINLILIIKEKMMKMMIHSQVISIKKMNLIIVNFKIIRGQRSLKSNKILIYKIHQKNNLMKIMTWILAINKILKFQVMIKKILKRMNNYKIMN